MKFPRAQQTIPLLNYYNECKRKGVSNSILSNDTPLPFTSELFKLQINIHLEQN